MRVVSSPVAMQRQALAWRDRIHVAEQNVAAAEQMLGGIREQFRDGTVTDLNIAQQETVVNGLRAQDEQQDQRIQQLERRVVADEGAGSAEGRRTADRQSRITMTVAVTSTILFLISAVASVILAIRPGG